MVYLEGGEVADLENKRELTDVWRTINLWRMFSQRRHQEEIIVRKR